MAGVKTCTACRTEKPLEDFHATKKSQDGRRTVCRPCRLAKEAVRRENKRTEIRAQQRDHYQRHREALCEKQRVYRRANRAKLRAYFREYRRRHPEIVRAGRLRWNALNPEKRRAHSALWNAINKGVIVPPTRCEDCPHQGYVEAHHDDYSKPLEVRWLCELCHSRADQARRERAA